VIVGLASGHSKTSLILTLISMTLNTTGAYSRIGRLASSYWGYLGIPNRRGAD
jgi:hypothetical protein